MFDRFSRLKALAMLNIADNLVALKYEMDSLKIIWN